MKKTCLALLAFFALAFTALAADVTGKWTGEITTGRGPQPINIELKQSGSTLTGAITGGRGGDIQISDGKVDGDTISFSTSAAGRDGTPNVQKYTGKVNGDSIEFTREGGRGPVTFTAKKQ
ncbi:MAG TPA: hypothetical protein VK789_18370 [Bryobacteraceae bacterium]|jgi:hypothetical protein|nr:hypothetical protein [Bryobacteraceae bacterium]